MCLGEIDIGKYINIWEFKTQNESMTSIKIDLELLIAALWLPAGKGLTSWLSFVMFNCDFVTFSSCILGQMWCFDCIDS